MKQLEFDFNCVLPDDDFSVEQHEFTVTDLLAGNLPSASPSLDFANDYDDDDDDFDDRCRVTDDLDRSYDQAKHDEDMAAKLKEMED